MRPELTPSLVRSLHLRAERDRLGLYLAEGPRFFYSARDSCASLLGAIVCRSLLPHLIANDIESHFKAARLPILHVNRGEFERLSQANEPAGVLMILSQNWQELPSEVQKGDLWLGVENLRTPGNLGTLLRSSAAFGVSGLMVFGPPRDRSDPYDPQVIRATMGTIFSMQLIATTHVVFRKWNREHGIAVLGAGCDAAQELSQVNLKRPSLLMLGNERKGLSEAQNATCTEFVRIPMVAGVDSLNVAMAGTILVYEAFRQRHEVR